VEPGSFHEDDPTAGCDGAEKEVMMEPLSSPAGQDWSTRQALGRAAFAGSLILAIHILSGGTAVQAEAQVQVQGPPPRAVRAVPAGLDAAVGTTGPRTFERWHVDGNPEIVGATFGSSWGDMDADGDPDLFLNKHYVGERPVLLRNDGGGLFTDVSGDVLDDPTLYRGDRHAGTWSDIDSDGEMDLMVAYGADYGYGGAPNRVFRFDAGIAIDLAAWCGLDAPLARSRAFQPLDWNNDGLTDYFLSAMPRPDGRAPRTLYLNAGSRDDPAFVDCAASLQLPVGTAYFTQTVPLPDGSIGFWMHGFPPAMYRFGVFPADDRTAALGLTGLHNVTDSAFADFDGDGDFDLFCTTARERSGVELDSLSRVEACLVVNGGAHGIDVAPSLVGTPVSFELRGYATPDDIHIGSTGTHPTYTAFTVDPSDPTTHGLRNYAGGQDRGIYLGFDAASGQWQLRVSSSTFYRVTVVASTTTGMLPPQAVGFDPHAVGLPDRLFLWDQGRFVPAPTMPPLSEPTDAMSCVAGDFDNDGDVDLYLVCTGFVSNRPNRYYRNMGAGRFLLIHDADGAPGSEAGRGDTVSTADFDGDGFLDLCVTNGEGDAPFFADGPVELFRSLPNGNHWLQLDLSSTVVNADAWGTRVTAWVGSRRIDRWQDCGVHRFSQDHARLHFGVGAATSIDRLQITWPDGQVDDHRAVPVDQTLRLQRR
jgi:hypothetical protein